MCENKKQIYIKGDDVMAVLTKPINKVMVLNAQESRTFIDEFNKNKVTKEFLSSCKKAGKLFNKGK